MVFFLFNSNTTWGTVCSIALRRQMCNRWNTINCRKINRTVFLMSRKLFIVTFKFIIIIIIIQYYCLPHLGVGILDFTTAAAAHLRIYKYICTPPVSNRHFFFITSFPFRNECDVWMALLERPKEYLLSKRNYDVVQFLIVSRSVFYF